MTEARDYSATLFLPQTDFPMRAGLPQKEPEILARWEDMGLYHAILRRLSVVSVKDARLRQVYGEEKGPRAWLRGPVRTARAISRSRG